MSVREVIESCPIYERSSGWTIEQMARAAGIHEQQVRDSINHMVEVGRVERAKFIDNGRGKAVCVYRVPQSCEFDAIRSPMRRHTNQELGITDAARMGWHR